MRENYLSGISARFRELSRSYRQVAYVLLTRPPLSYSRRNNSARLACIRHAASVRPEPGSNSPLKVSWFAQNFLLACLDRKHRSATLSTFLRLKSHLFLHSLFSFQRTNSFVSIISLLARQLLYHTIRFVFLSRTFLNSFFESQSIIDCFFQTSARLPKWQGVSYQILESSATLFIYPFLYKWNKATEPDKIHAALYGYEYLFSNIIHFNLACK